MTHPGEQFYPQGVHWDDPIARGTLPDLLSKAARDYGARCVIEFRDRPIAYSELEALVEVAASAYLRAGYGKNTTVALFLGNCSFEVALLQNYTVRVPISEPATTLSTFTVRQRLGAWRPLSRSFK